MATKMRFNPAQHHGIAEVPPPADTSWIKQKFIDIPYADLSSRQKLDIYLPNDIEGPFPVIISIHGGAFMGCDKGDEQLIPMLEGLKRGYAVVSCNYRLSWEATFPALVQDAKAVVRWVRGNALKYDFNPDWISSWGGSAGGYLTCMLGVSAGEPELEDLSLGNPDQSCHIQAAVDWFGPNDFLKMDPQLIASGLTPEPGTEHSGPNSPESLLLGEQITKIPELVKAANPETYIKADAPPFLIQHGTLDPIVPVQQSVNFAEKLKSAIGEENVTLELLKGLEHGDERFATAENVDRVLDFLDQQLISA